jgi:Tol biopolymer transport system component
VFSRDGQRLAFLSRRRGEGEQVWLAAPDGSGAQRFTLRDPVNINPTGLPDGSALAYLTLRDDHLDLVVTDVHTRQTRTLRTIAPWTPEGRNRFTTFAIAQNGRALLFRRVIDGISNMWLMDDIANGEAHAITQDAEGAMFPVPSATGRWIAYQVAAARRRRSR